MRLVCPNCGAQYEIPDGVIPEAGRDVQCSSCGNTWFQAHPDNDPGLADELDIPPEARADTDFEPEPEDVAVPDSAPETGRKPVPDPVPDPVSDPVSDPVPVPEEEPSALPRTEPTRRKLNPDVAELLRQEAEHEARVRATEQDPLESQPDLGLDAPEPQDEAARRAREARDRMARMRGEDPGAEARQIAAAAAGSRRDLLPDIDEINSTLRSSGERRSAEGDAVHDVDEAEQKTGFGRGFGIVVLVALAALALYIFAPALARAVPALADPLAAYVGALNAARGWLDVQLSGFIGFLGGAAADAPPAE